MGFPGRAYVVDTGIMFFFRKEFQGGKLVVLKAALCPATRFQAGHLGPYKKNTRILLHLPDPRDSQEWLMLRAVCCSTGSQLQCLGKSPCAPFPARNDPFRAQLTSSQRSLLERVKKIPTNPSCRLLPPPRILNLLQACVRPLPWAGAGGEEQDSSAQPGRRIWEVTMPW